MSECFNCGDTTKIELSLKFIFSFQSVKPTLLCKTCQDLFQEIYPEKACRGCSRLQESTDYCLDCEKWQKYSPDIEPKHTALYVYNEMAAEYMNQFKFQGDVELANVFSEKLFEFLNPFQKTHFITVVPTSETSLKERGFNQVELLLKSANIAYEPLLQHVKKTQKQSSKTRGERLKSVQPFALISQKDLEGIKKPILIIDDVYTTGRTIFHARKLLEGSVDTASATLFR